jgi:hypothetical protein
MIALPAHHWSEWTRHARLWTEPIKWVFYIGAGWGSIYLNRWKKSRDEMVAQGWPSVEGRISSCTVARIPKTSRFNVVLKYTYFVEEYRLGQYVHEFAKESDADNFARQMRDQRIQIRYKQSNPNKSVLEQRVIEQLVLLAPHFG